MFPLTPGVWFLQPANDVDKVDLPSLHSAQILTNSTQLRGYNEGFVINAG